MTCHDTKPTGKTHQLTTLQDLLSLEPDELQRMLPDLVAWHLISREAAFVMDVPVSEMRAHMKWTDDGDTSVNAIKVDLGDHGVIDLLQIAANQEPKGQKEDSHDTKPKPNRGNP